MAGFLGKRIALAIPTLIAVSFLVFLAARLAPSGPVEIKLGDKATPDAVARLKHEYGLDRPLLTQYGDYLRGIVTRGDFGKSFARGDQPVAEMIRTDFPVTRDLAIAALLFAMLLGLPVGIVAALYHNSWFDRIAMSLVVVAVSIPGMVLGPLMMLVFAVRLRWLPVSGWESPVSMILPTITLGARSAALIARFMRASLLETLRQDYIRTALAKGLSRGQTVWRHALKNAFLPVLTVLGTSFGALLTGSFVVETIFQVPGIGFESINSITRRDYPVIQAMALLVAVVFVLVNLAVDVLYGFVDPRIRTQETRA